jgi:uncharacterized protein (UPF0548 family)
MLTTMILPMPRHDLDALTRRPLTYSWVGATTQVPVPQNARVWSRLLGTGSATFDLAVHSVRTWRVHRGAGLHVRASSPTADLGSVVELRWGPAIRVPCRVVTVLDEEHRQGFAYGTLPGHPERGEEAFVVERADDGTVRFHVVACAQPARWYARLAPAVARGMQSMIVGRYLRAAAEATADRDR